MYYYNILDILASMKNLFFISLHDFCRLYEFFLAKKKS